MQPYCPCVPPAPSSPYKHTYKHTRRHAGVKTQQRNKPTPQQSDQAQQCQAAKLHRRQDQSLHALRTTMHYAKVQGQMPAKTKVHSHTTTRSKVAAMHCHASCTAKMHLRVQGTGFKVQSAKQILGCMCRPVTASPSCAPSQPATTCRPGNHASSGHAPCRSCTDRALVAPSPQPSGCRAGQPRSAQRPPCDPHS